MAEEVQAAVDRTRQALEVLAERWAKDEVGQSIKKVLEDASGLSEEGFKWSKEVGLNYVLPTEALTCQAISKNVARDGLRASTNGGPAAATHRGVCVAPAPPCGFGVFATSNLKKGERLGEYTGEIRSYDVWCEEIKARKKAARGSEASSPFIREELYAAWGGSGPAGAGVVVDAFALGNTMRFINCSCKPCVTFKSFGTGSENHSRLEVVTLRDIEAGEQISVDYGWYHDPATLEDIQGEALAAYAVDLAELQRLALPAAGAEGEEIAGPAASASDAVHVIAEALLEARGRPPLRHAPASFLCRYIDNEAVARLLEKGPGFTKANTYQEIPNPVWQLYEVVGAERVGVPCRCALDRSLNAGGRCSGIIGRPLQIKHWGKGDPECS